MKISEDNDSIVWEDEFGDKHVEMKIPCRVRFPNDTFIDNVKIAPSDFKEEADFKEVVFGWWGETWVELQKEWYEVLDNYEPPTHRVLMNPLEVNNINYKRCEY